MSARMEGGNLVISIIDVLRSLSAEERDSFAQALSCEDAVIVNVVDQIVDGSTRDTSHGSSNTLLEQRKRILEAVDQVRFKVVGELMRSLAVSKFVEDRSSEWAWNLWHAWPSEYAASRPSPPKEWNPDYPSDEEIMREMRK